MYNGSISELTHRVINAEKVIDELKKTDIVIPGEDIKSVDDFNIEG